MELTRSCGLLLPVTALPTPRYCGDLGSGARRWLDFCQSAGCRWWQILPFGPTGYGNSPYQCFSAFAGNPLWISAEELWKEGLLPDPPHLPSEPSLKVDYSAAFQEQSRLLSASWRQFQSHLTSELKQNFDSFYEQTAGWLDDYALFMVIRSQQQFRSWQQWPDPLRYREPAALQQFRQDHREALQQICYEQWLFDRQWQKLRRDAEQRNIGIIGDIPLFVSYDSADVWARPELFKLDQYLQPEAVAGVPPDYFSPDGQLWGNPVYDWEQHLATGFSWWVARLRQTIRNVDLVRLDHFRGFSACWEIPVGEKTARNGSWVEAAGRQLLLQLRRELGVLPLLAEDLGVITADVEQLRDDFKLPGMTIAQFAFDGKEDNSYLPHNHRELSVAYTGTHDNDTTSGWWQSADVELRNQVLTYLESSEAGIVEALLEAVVASPARLAILPLQDLLRQGSEYRTNLPGSATGNWEYRCQVELLQDETAGRLRELNRRHNRLTDMRL